MACLGALSSPRPLQFQNSPEPDLEIVMCSGYGKNGALSVLQVCVGRPGWGLMGTWVDRCTPLSFQKSIRPQVVTTFELPGCYDMWTVVAPVRKEQVRAPQAARRPRGATGAVFVRRRGRGLRQAQLCRSQRMRQNLLWLGRGAAPPAPGWVVRCALCPPITGGDPSGRGRGAGAQHP